MSALDKVLRLTGNAPAPVEVDSAAEMVLAALASLDEAYLSLADSDDDGDDDSDGGDDDDKDDDSGHDSHATYKKLVKKGVNPKLAAKMCAKSDNVKATAVRVDEARSALRGLHVPVELSVLTAEDRKKDSAHTIPGSTDFPIPDKGHLSSALARYRQGALAGHSRDEVRRHILSRARALGAPVDL